MGFRTSKFHTLSPNSHFTAQAYLGLHRKPVTSAPQNCKCYFLVKVSIGIVFCSSLTYISLMPKITNSRCFPIFQPDVQTQSDFSSRSIQTKQMLLLKTYSDKVVLPKRTTFVAMLVHHCHSGLRLLLQPYSYPYTPSGSHFRCFRGRP